MTVDKVIGDLKSREREGAGREDVERWCGAVDQSARQIWARSGLPLPAAEGEALLIPPPWDEVYFHYCTAQICFLRRDYEDYANSMAQFNELYQSYARHHRRSVTPARSGCVML